MQNVESLLPGQSFQHSFQHSGASFEHFEGSFQHSKGSFEHFEGSFQHSRGSFQQVFNNLSTLTARRSGGLQPQHLLDPLGDIFRAAERA